MKRLGKIVALSTAVLSVFALGACGNSSSADANGKQQIVIWGGVPAENGINDVIKGFEKQNKNVTVKYVRYTNDATGNAKLDTALMAGEKIDVFFSYSPSSVYNRSHSGIAAELPQFDKDGILDQVSKDNLKIDGKTYTVPTAAEPTGIVYNKTALKKLGITIPDNWTWDDLKEIAKKATHEENGKTVYGLAGDWHDEQTQVLGGDAEYSEDGNSPDFTNPGWKIKQYYYDMLYKDKSAYPFSQVMARKLYRGEYQLLLTGDALMGFYQPWMSRTLSDTEQFPRDFQLGFAPLPKAEIPGVESKDYNGQADNFMQINSKSEHQDTAWKLIKYFMTDGAKDYLKAGKINMLDGVATDDDVVEQLLGADAEKTYDTEQFKKNILSVRNFYVPTKFKARESVSTMENEEEQSYYLKSKTFDQYIDSMTKRFAAELKKQ